VVRLSLLACRAGQGPARQSSDRPFNPGYGGRKVYFLKGSAREGIFRELYLFARSQSFPNSRDGNLVLGRDKQAFFSARRLRAAPKDTAADPPWL